MVPAPEITGLAGVVNEAKRLCSGDVILVGHSLGASSARGLGPFA
jgi:hypothetical protein